MGYHAMGSLEIWDRMVHVIYYTVFDEWTDIRRYMFVVVLIQNTLMVGKGPGWRWGGGGGGGQQQVFSSLQRGNRKFLNQLRGE